MTAVQPPPPVAPPPLPRIKIQVSDIPAERINQLAGFFRRNPGYAKTSPTNDAMVGVLERHKPTRWLADVIRPTELGQGQAIYDQMQWQIRTGRQPDNPWWMRMNKQTVLDPLVAEAHIRAGRESELKTRSEKDWAKFIKRSDQIRGVLGVAPGEENVMDKNGQLQPIAISDAWRGASLLKRAVAKWWLVPQAKRAFWRAHVTSLHEARQHVDRQFVEMDKRAPSELQLSSGFRNFVNGYILLSPPAVGGFTRLGQRTMLPESHPVDIAKLPLRQRIAYRIMTALDPTYELDKKRIAETGPTKTDQASAAG